MLTLLLTMVCNFFTPDIPHPYGYIPQPEVSCEITNVHEYEQALIAYNRHMEKVRQRAIRAWVSAHNRLDRRVREIASLYNEDLNPDQKKELCQAFAAAMQNFWAEVMPTYHQAKQELYQAQLRFKRIVCN